MAARVFEPLTTTPPRLTIMARNDDSESAMMCEMLAARLKLEMLATDEALGEAEAAVESCQGGDVGGSGDWPGVMSKLWGHVPSHGGAFDNVCNQCRFRIQIRRSVPARQSSAISGTLLNPVGHVRLGRRG